MTGRLLVEESVNFTWALVTPELPSITAKTSTSTVVAIARRHTAELRLGPSRQENRRRHGPFHVDVATNERREPRLRAFRLKPEADPGVVDAGVRGIDGAGPDVDRSQSARVGPASLTGA